MPQLIDICSLYEGKVQAPVEDNPSCVQDFDMDTASSGCLAMSKPLHWRDNLLSQVVMFLYIGSMYYVPVSIGLMFYFLGFYAGVAMLVLWVVVAALFRKSRWPFPYPNHFIVRALMRYFSVRFLYEDFDEVRKAEFPRIELGMPHGVFPGGNMLYGFALPKVFKAPVRGVALVASIILRLPVYNTVLRWLGSEPANREQAQQALQQHLRLGIVPGGIAEIFESTSEAEALYISKRKGFVRLALQYGAPIAVTYVFGQTQLFSCISDPWSILQSLSNRVRFSITLFWGKWFLPIPHRVPLLMVFGKLIRVPKIEHPTQEDVDRYHGIVVEKTKEVFEKYKHLYGWETKKLVIR